MIYNVHIVLWCPILHNHIIINSVWLIWGSIDTYIESMNSKELDYQ